MRVLYVFDPTLSDDERDRVFKRGARAEGCTCDCTVGRLVTVAPGIYTARIHHDDWCALLRRIRARSN